MSTDLREHESLDWLILGAGLSGLTLAQELKRVGKAVVILEKSRGVGGRMATRRWEGGVYDHGAQFFTVRSPEFAGRVRKWIERGAVRSWFEHSPWEGSIHGAGDKTAATSMEGHPRYVGSHGMTTIPKLLAEGLDIRKETMVEAIGRRDTGWIVTTRGGEVWPARHLILTAPLPQSLALLEAVPGFRERSGADLLARADYHPCLAFLLHFSEDPGLPPPGACKPGTEPIAWIGDNRAKGISSTPAITLHSTPAFARKHWESPDEVRIPAMLEHLSPWLQAAPERVSCHRWRYGEMIQGVGVDSFWDPDWSLGLCGDGFTGGRVEGAFLSALDLAKRILGPSGIF